MSLFPVVRYAGRLKQLILLNSTLRWRLLTRRRVGSFRLAAAVWIFLCSSALACGAPRLPPEDAAFLDRLERACFDYFWLEANPANGLIKDRSTPDSKCSIAAVGFGLSGIHIAIKRGWISRAAGRARVLATLRTFVEGPQGPEAEGIIGHRGWFYHFLDMDTATRGVRRWKSELSSIDTALLLAGVLDAREFFDRRHADERRIRELSDKLVRGVDWAWMADGGSLLRTGWNPESGFIPHRWKGYNEAMLLYVLALGADALKPAKERARAPVLSWEAWTHTYKWRTNYGFAYVEFAPLFGHQYSHCWVDFRGIADGYLRSRGMTYFENSRRATLAQRAYAMANPASFPDYGPLEWGFTACDGPERDGYQGYIARGAPPPENDDGTIAPTAPGGSLPFAPEVCLPTLRNFDVKYHDRLWTRYGFGDAFNVKADWYASVVLGIDQGPILLMAENYRTGSGWRRMMKNAVIRRGLERAGFERLPVHSSKASKGQTPRSAR